MSYRTLTRAIASVGLMAALALMVPSTASAQSRSRGRAVPRGSGSSSGRVAVPSNSVRVVRPPIVVAPYRVYRPSVNFGFFFGRPGFYGSYVYGSPFYAYGYPAYGYGYGYDYPYGYVAPYGYGYGGYSGRPYGGVRIDIPQRDAEVFVDGYFVGIVDDFDGRLQQANIEAGPHRIEIRANGFEPITFDVNVEPGRTITYRSSMRPLQP